MWYFNEEEILLLHYKLIERFGGSHGVRDIERLRSVVHTPKQSVFGTDQYESLFEKSAVYIRNIIGDHPFVDGNKRSGISAGIFFLNKNGAALDIKRGELEDFAVRVAVDKLDVPEIAKWLQDHSLKRN
jgi:death-on-curing protein